MSYRIVTTIIIALCALNTLKAQPREGKFINASIGYGLTDPYDELEVNGSGFYAQGEYVWTFSRWIGVRPYAGVLFTSPANNAFENDEIEYKVTTNAFMFGGKVRFAAPIPYVAPFIELGIGGSVGSFVTHTPLSDKEEKGLIMHIPFSVGLAIGRDHTYEVAFTYYYHDTVKQFGGAIAFGMAFPLE